MARLRSCLLLVALLLVMIGVAPAHSARAQTGGVVISHVYGGGGNSGATLTNDFIELFNAGDTPAIIASWSVQYASAAGTSWSRTNLVDITLQPGQYYLVQEAAGAGGTVSLPTPDATGAIAMGAGAGKVALVSNQTNLTVSNPFGMAGVVDLVGYGTTANGFEGAGPAPAPSNINSIVRADGGCTDTNQNNADFSTNNPASAVPPHNTATALNPCNADNAPSVTGTNPADGATSVAINANINITFSEPVTVSDGWFDITCTGPDIHTAAVTGGPQSFTLNPDTSFDQVEDCTVTVTGALVADQDGVPPDTMADDYEFTFTTADLSSCGTAATPIHDIQGNGSDSPVVGAIHTVEGTVVGDFQGSNELKGFYVQEEDADADGESLTSEGVFVFDNLLGADVVVGDRARVTGRVTEFNGLTELSSVTEVLICGADSLPAAAAINLPFDSLDSPEPVEGMRVSLPQTLTATEVFDLGNFGEVLLSSGGRLSNPTNVVEPGAPAIEYKAANLLNTIVLDDGSSASDPDPTPYLFGEPTLRLGDTVTGLTGVMSYGFGAYRIEPTSAPAFVRANPRTPSPEDVGGMLKVGSFNVLNYFNGDGAGGGFPTSRGADTLAEFNRQRAKTIAAIVAADPDVAGLMEMENDDPATENAAIEDLVEGLNAATAPETYAFIDTDGTLGTDLIRVAVIYKRGSVTPFGPWATIETGPFEDRSRPPVAQTFEEIATGEKFIFVVNHLKSKGSCPSDAPETNPEADQGDGQGCWNPTRKESVNLMMTWLGTDPTGTGDPDILIMGDMNAYAKEDPIDIFVSNGYTNLIADKIGEDAYSYVFDGEAGYLDHALSSPSLTPRITGVAEWHNNADEPPVLDYNVEDKSAAQQALNVGTPYRASDHDPVIVGMTLGEPVVAVEPESQSLVFGDLLVGSASAAQAVTVTNDGSLPLEVGAVSLSGDFDIDTDTCSSASVLPGDSCAVGVTFKPTTTGPHTGELTIPSNAASSPDSVSLAGVGIQPGVSLTPDALDFGSQVIGFTSAPQAITLANGGSAPLLVSEITPSDGFAVSGGTCTAAPFSLAVDASCTLDVTFSPTTTGPYDGSLVVASDAPTSPDSAALSGNGITNHLLVNGGFEIDENGNHIPDHWIAKGLGRGEGQDCTVALEGDCSLELGGRGKTRIVSQLIAASGGAGEHFLFSISNKAERVRGHGSFLALITITYEHGRRGIFWLEFDPGTYDWQASDLAFSTVKSYRKISVTLLFGKDGTTWFDAASLLRVP